MNAMPKVLIEFLAFVGVAYAMLVWLVAVPHTPDLTPAKAAEIISRMAEFNRVGRLPVVSSTTRGVDSLKDCCYSANFTFVANKSNARVEAEADFQYWDGAWHLKSFNYGSSGRRVWIESD